MLQRCFGRPVTSASTPDAAEPLAHGDEHPGQVDRRAREPGGDHLLDLGVPLGVKRGEGQVLELPLELLDAQPVSQRRVDVEGLLSGPSLLPLRHHRDGPHVVEPVGQLDHEDAPVVGHGDEHLADRGGLLGLFGVELEPVELGDPVDDRRHLGPELLFTSSRDKPVSSTASWSMAAATDAGRVPGGRRCSRRLWGG